MSNRVLLIEDNTANMELMLYLLQSYGFDVLGCATGAEGLAAAGAGGFDIILCDIQLPDMNGMEIARQLTSAQHPPIVALTALAMIGDRDRILAAGFDGYISKPIEPKAFMESVKQFLPEEKRPTTTAPISVSVSGAVVAQPAAPAAARNQTILVIDDMAENRYLMQTLLQATGFHIIEASCAGEGIEKARVGRPQMIICDVNMPLTDGEAFLRLLKADPELANIPVLMVTSSDRPTRHTHERLRQAGAIALLSRPVESAQLLQLIEARLAP